jgi:hypothetical protein
LAEQQQKALDGSEQPAVAVDPRTGQTYRLIGQKVYEVMSGIARPFNRSWNDPADGDLIRTDGKRTWK